MSSSNNSNYNARRGYATTTTGESQGNHISSSLRRSHLYGKRGTLLNLGGTGTGAEDTGSLSSNAYSRLDGTRPLSNSQTSALPTASEYFAREAATSVVRSKSPAVPWSRTASRFKINGVPSTSSYGLPPTPESDVSVSRIATPPKQRDHQFNVDMMQRMTQHAKISPLNQYNNLKKELAEENLVVDGANVDRLVARAGERVSGTNRGYEPTSGDQLSSRRVAFRSPEAVEGAREASRRLNGASTIDRQSSLYEPAPKPAEPISSRPDMYAELKRTLSESSSERPKRVALPLANQRQLPPLSPVHRRHVEIRPRRPVAGSHSNTPSPIQNDYYSQGNRPKTSQGEPVDWLAAAEDVEEKPSTRRRQRPLSTGKPLTHTAMGATRQSDQFGGELKKGGTDSWAIAPASKLVENVPQTKTEARISPAAKLPLALSNSYMQHDLVDFVSEDDLTLNLSRESKPPIAFRGTPAANTKKPAASRPSKGQDASFLQSTKKTDPDETLDTLRQLSRLLNGNTPNKDEGRKILELAAARSNKKAAEAKQVTKPPVIVDTRQPYKHQSRPLSTRKQNSQGVGPSKLDFDPKPVDPERYKDVGLASILSNQSGLRRTPASTHKTQQKPIRKPNFHKKPSTSSTSASTIKFEDDYETDDSLDRLLTNDTDYASLLKPAAFEDETFLQGTIQVADQSISTMPQDFETLALRTKVLNNLQTVQLDIRETRKGLESIERRFGLLEDEGMLVKLSESPAKHTAPEPAMAAPPRIIMINRRRQRPAGKPLFKKPWTFRDYFCAILFIVLALAAIEFKLWSDTIIPQYSRVSSDEWFAKHPVGSYRPGGTFRAVIQAFVLIGYGILYMLEQTLAMILWMLAGVQWLEIRVMDSIAPPPPGVAEYANTTLVSTMIPTLTSTSSMTTTEVLVYGQNIANDVQNALPAL
ncbi:hypothetical protein TWF192_005234 [Orbilia oligospora]|uniref:Uncharacterized protein n=1 Tax=Orbilia oligospora TaxID=2813651 RepID=A0A6G1LRN5_ORBOL|nr:hypothetical protein TWF191_006662 [Orbilia oligospora]KAF3229983.1 hypothetical protein TWF192_005234 [Orbilia oligospora]